MRNPLGSYLRKCRTDKQLQHGREFSLRQVAARVHVEPSYLSKIERGIEPRPSEATTKALARELGEDPDVLLAMGGKVSADLQTIICTRPKVFAALIRELRSASDNAVLRLVREVRDGDW